MADGLAFDAQGEPEKHREVLVSEGKDKLEFKLADPIEKKEEWALEFGSTQKVVEIYLNGRELVEILKEMETPYALEEGHPSLAGAYGHNYAKELYADLTEAMTEGTYCHEKGAELLCCSGCGDRGCWSVLVMVKQDEDYVYWEQFRNNHRKWNYNIAFCFVKKEYEAAMKQLKEFAEDIM